MDPDSKLHKKAGSYSQNANEKKADSAAADTSNLLIAEMPELCFDYFSLQRRCSYIFDAFRAIIFPQAMDDQRFASSPILPTMRILELASYVQTLQSNKIDASDMLTRMGFGPSRTPIGSTADRLNAQLHVGVSLDDSNLLHANSSVVPSMHDVALGPLKQASDIMQLMLKRKEGDVKIKKLHVIAGGTDYGCFMFLRKLLQALYGDVGLSQVSSASRAKMVYNSRKRDLSRCQFREHAQTAGQKRVNKRIGHKWGLQFMAMILGAVARHAGKKHKWSQEGIDWTVALIEEHIEKLVDPDSVENLGGLLASRGLDPED